MRFTVHPPKEGRADGPGGRDWLACAFQMPGLVFVAAVCTPGRTRGRAQVPLGCLSGPGSWRGPPLQLAMAPQLGGIPRAPPVRNAQAAPPQSISAAWQGPGRRGRRCFGVAVALQAIQDTDSIKHSAWHSAGWPITVSRRRIYEKPKTKDRRRRPKRRCSLKSLLGISPLYQEDDSSKHNES